MVSLKSILKVCAPLLALAVSGSAFADAPAYVRVRSLSYAGSGCPAGSVATNTSPDRQAFTVLFDQYIAEVGPGVPFNQKRKNCQLNVDLDFPGGWSYSIVTVDYRGYVALEQGVKGTQQSSYYFQGQGSTGTLKTPMFGPIDQNYQIRDTLGLQALVWSPCGAQRSLNINSQLILDNSARPSAHGLLTNDSIDFQSKLIYGIQWQRCR